MSKSQQWKNCPAVQAEPSWHFSPTCIPFKGQDFKECAFQRSHELTQAAGQRSRVRSETCFLITLKECLSSLAHRLLPPGTFPRQSGLGWRAVQGTHFERKGKGNVFRSSYPGDSLNISQSVLWWVYASREGAVLPQKSQIYLLMYKKLKSECCLPWLGRHACIHSFAKFT